MSERTQRLLDTIRNGAQCTYVVGDGSRCPHDAVGVLIGPDAQPVRGVTCAACAEHAIDKYWDTYGEFWSFVT